MALSLRFRASDQTQRVWLKTYKGPNGPFYVCCVFKTCIQLISSMAHADSPSFLSLPPPSRSTRTPSSLFTTSHGDYHCQGALSGRFAEQSPCTGYEPKDPIEVHDSEFTPTFFPRKTTRTSACNTTEDVETPPYDLEADGSRNKGMLASPLCLQERDASADSTRVDCSNGDNPVSVFQLVHLLSKPVPGHFSR